MTDTRQLLTDYAHNGSESAFRELVTRYLDLVHSTALRLVDGDTHRARDVAQVVFVDLAAKVPSLPPEVMLGGWLHRHTCFVAANTMRGERRRQARERQAVTMNVLENSAPDNFARLAPVLDEIINTLDEPDRSAILLRFYEQQDFSAIGRTLGTSEDAARMRLNRALDKLQQILKTRGIQTTAAALSVTLFAGTVTAAPAALAATITATALTGTAAVSTSTFVAATKTIAMTTLQKVLVTAALTATIGGGIYEAHQAAQLRSQNQSLQQQLTPLATQLQQLQQERDTAASQVASLNDQLAKTKSNEQELLKLRNEATLRRRNPASDTVPVNDSISPVQTAQNNQPPSADPAREELGRQLGQAVVRGDMGAFEKLLAESNDEYGYFRTNNVDLDDTKRGALAFQTFAPINAAFKIIAEAATAGSQPALDALARALQVPGLNGQAIHSLGGLAANGDEGALEILTHPEKYGSLLSSTITPLKPAADNGNQKAINALAAVANNPKDQPLWYMTAESLTKAAADGNSVAVDALITMSSSTNRFIQKVVAQALQGAAANQNAKAAAALRTLNLQ